MVTAGLSWDDTIGTSLIYFLSTYARWEDDRRTSTQPTLPLNFQEENTKVNVRIGVGGYSGAWTVELWGANVTDEQTRNVTFNIPLRVGAPGGFSARGGFIEAPRTYGATLRLRL